MGALILTVYNLEYKYILKIDISNRAIRAYLTQKQPDKKLKTIAYFLRKITKPELNYNIYDKELLTIVETIKH